METKKTFALNYNWFLWLRSQIITNTHSIMKNNPFSFCWWQSSDFHVLPFPKKDIWVINKNLKAIWSGTSTSHSIALGRHRHWYCGTGGLENWETGKSWISLPKITVQSPPEMTLLSFLFTPRKKMDLPWQKPFWDLSTLPIISTMKVGLSIIMNCLASEMPLLKPPIHWVL